MKKRRINRGKWHLTIAGFGGKDVHGSFGPFEPRRDSVVTENCLAIRYGLHLGLGYCFFNNIDNKEQTAENSSEFTQEEIHEYLDAETKAIEYLCKGIEIPEGLREFLLKTIDRRDRLRDLMMPGQIKLDTNNEEVGTEELFDDIFNA